MNEVKVRLNTALFNAGMVGFINLLKRGGISYGKTDGDELIVNAKELADADLARLYIDETVDKFKESTKIYSALNKLDSLIAVKEFETKEQEEDFFKSCKELSAVLLQASIQTGLKTLAEEGIPTNIIDACEKLKKETNTESCKVLLRQIHEDCQNSSVVQTLYMKNIIYNKIRMVWDGISFLNRQEAAADIKKSYEKAFVSSLKEMLFSEKKHKKTCSCCDIVYDDLKSFSYINDIGIDANRKKSAFWNMKSDLAICPLCSLIFTCSPLGFNQLGQDLVFINQNQSIDSLISANAKFEYEEDKGSFRYQLITNLILKEIEVKQKEIDNIEVLTRHKDEDKGYYSLDIIDKNLLTVFDNCKTELNYLKSSKAKTDSGFISIIEETLNCLFSRRALWNLMFKLLKSGSNPFPIRQLLNIQIKRKEEKSVGYKMVRANTVWSAGNALKKSFDSDNTNSNKLRGAIIKLQNAVRVEDRDLFFDILIRLYSGIGKAIPDVFLQAMNDPEDFKQIGTAFILGALGQKTEETNKDKEPIKE